MMKRTILNWFLTICAVLAAYFIIQPEFGPRDFIKIDLWITHGRSYLFGLNTGLYGKTTQGASGAATDRVDDYVSFQDRVGFTQNYTFYFGAGDMESFKVKIYRNKKLCASFYHKFEKDFDFQNRSLNNFAISCDPFK